MDGSIVKDYTNKWKVTYIAADGTETPNKIWTDYGQIIELDGKKYFHRVQDLYDPKMNLQNTWINMVEHETLAPVSFSTLSPRGKFSHYNFSGVKITGSTNLASKENNSTPVEVQLEEAVYDWNLYGMLLVGLPLKKGLIAKMPFYGPQANQLKWLVASIQGKEDLELPNGNGISTFKINTNQKSSLLGEPKCTLCYQTRARSAKWSDAPLGNGLI